MDVFDDQFPSWEGQGVGSSMKKLHMTSFCKFMLALSKECIRTEVLTNGTGRTLADKSDLPDKATLVKDVRSMRNFWAKAVSGILPPISKAN